MVPGGLSAAFASPRPRAPDWPGCRAARATAARSRRAPCPACCPADAPSPTPPLARARGGLGCGSLPAQPGRGHRRDRRRGRCGRPEGPAGRRCRPRRPQRPRRGPARARRGVRRLLGDAAERGHRARGRRASGRRRRREVRHLLGLGGPRTAVRGRARRPRSLSDYRVLDLLADEMDVPLGSARRHGGRPPDRRARRLGRRAAPAPDVPAAEPPDVGPRPGRAGDPGTSCSTPAGSRTASRGWPARPGVRSPGSPPPPRPRSGSPTASC